jgi:hypothetical protein
MFDAIALKGRYDLLKLLYSVLIFVFAFSNIVVFVGSNIITICLQKLQIQMEQQLLLLNEDYYSPTCNKKVTQKERPICVDGVQLPALVKPRHSMVRESKSLSTGKKLAKIFGTSKYLQLAQLEFEE